MSQIITLDEERLKFYDITYSSPPSYSNIRRVMTSNLKYVLPVIQSARTINLSSASTSSYYSLRSKLSKSNYRDHLYPIAVRYISKDNQFLIERPPFQLEVDFRLGSANSRATKLPSTKIWIPWTVMVVRLNSLTSADFSSVKLFFNDGPLTSVDDYLLPTWLPNSYNSGSICFSSSLNDFTSVLDVDQVSQGDLNYIYNYIFNNFMMGGWNSDLNLHFNYLYIDQYYAATYPTLAKYNYPTKDTIKEIVSRYPNPDDAKYIKKCLSSVQTIQTYRNSVNAYVKHFASLSALTLEETLSLITEAKELNKVKLNSYSISNILKNDLTASSKYEHNSFVSSFATTVMSHSDLSVDHDYLVTDNFVYFDTAGYSPSLVPDFENNNINQNSYSITDDLYQYIGPKNLSILEDLLRSMNKQNISNRIIYCSINQNTQFYFDILPETTTFSSLLKPHHDALYASFKDSKDLNKNVKEYINEQFKTFSLENDNYIHG